MRRRLLSILAAILCISAAETRGANCYWDNGGGDGRWTNPTNWLADSVPLSNDTVYLANNCPDTPQTLVLDTNAMLATLQCTATNNRSYTINPTNGCALYFLGATDIQGTGRQVPLTINADIRYWDTFSVQRKSQTVALNGSVTPLTGLTNSFIVSEAGTLVLGGSNAFGFIRNDNGGEVLVRHPYALGTNYYRNQGADGTLSLATNAFITGDLTVSANMNVRLNDSGTNDVTLTILGLMGGAMITVQPPVNGASGNLILKQYKDGPNNTAELFLRSDSRFVMTNNPGGARISWGSATDGYIGGEGSVVFEGDSLYFYSTNDYSGGTFIRMGTVYMIGNDRFPTNGLMSVTSPGVLDLHGSSATIARITGDGTIDSDPTKITDPAGTLAVTGTLAPGLTNGVTAFTGRGNLTLGNACTSKFELVSVSGVSDKVVFPNLGSLTLGGRLEAVDAGGLEVGSYKIFDLNGGAIAGTYSEVTVPKGFRGSTEILGGDVYLKIRGATPGTVISVR